MTFLSVFSLLGVPTSKPIKVIARVLEWSNTPSKSKESFVDPKLVLHVYFVDRNECLLTKVFYVTDFI